VCFAHADVADEEKASAIDWVFLDKLAGGEAGRSQLLVRAVGLKIRELAVFVTPGNAGRSEQSLGAGPQAAIASGDPTLGAEGDRFPSSTFTQRTNFCRNLHNLGSTIGALAFA